MRFAKSAIMGVLGGVMAAGSALAVPITGLGVPSDAIFGGTVVNFESVATDTMPVSFDPRPSTATLDPRVGAQTSISVGGGLTISGHDRISNTASALYVTPEIVLIEMNIPTFIGSGGAIKEFDYYDYAGTGTFNTSGNFLMNWEKDDGQHFVFQERHTNEFEFSFNVAVDQFAFNFGANDNEWRLTAFDEDDLEIDSLLIPAVNVANVSDGQYYGLAVAGIKRLTLSDTSVDAVGASCVPSDSQSCGEWVMLDNLTYARNTIAPVPIPAALPLMLGGL
ncbi:MAG: hypothetical protein ACJAVS_000718, partial [Paracoccaceae bacterium]